MGNNVVSFAGANLPAVKTLATSLRNIEADVGAAGVVILKMDKTGCWIFGADQTETQEGSKWAVNPFSFIHGHIAWGDGEVLGERMTGIANPLPEQAEVPPGAKKGWEIQIGLSMKCLNGDDKDMEARYTTTAVGGKRAVQALAVAIAEQVEKDQTKPVPVVLLETDHYQHKSYGKIYTPVFRIVEWVSMDGGAADKTSGGVGNGPAPDAAAPAARRPAVVDTPTGPVKLPEAEPRRTATGVTEPATQGALATAVAAGRRRRRPAAA